ncbi:AraC family transcriptional regulator [Crocinitomicaceae bacterium]|nr:AraC family transcriptional regulator [Crocinitomicaceae bacterium]
MSDQIIHITNLSQAHEVMGIDPPKHPLISIIHWEDLTPPKEKTLVRYMSDFYTVMLKDADCGLQYGRNYYDFNEGLLTFMGPKQVFSTTNENFSATGWMLAFHPDLIRTSNLGKIISNYSFFSYDVHEALHLSDKEEDILNDCISKMEFELEQNIDAHSKNLLVSNIELLLNYCNRFYERQFHTRADSHSDVVTSVERLIKDYYDEGKQLKEGTPSIQYLANKVNLSANYLSDLLKKETGRNTKEHINNFVVDRAKTILLNSEDNVSEIAYDLGFNYPHYFSRMFKKDTGMTPQKYREQNLN